MLVNKHTLDVIYKKTFAISQRALVERNTYTDLCKCAKCVKCFDEKERRI